MKTILMKAELVINKKSNKVAPVESVAAKPLPKAESPVIRQIEEEENNAEHEAQAEKLKEVAKDERHFVRNVRKRSSNRITRMQHNMFYSDSGLLMIAIAKQATNYINRSGTSPAC